MAKYIQRYDKECNRYYLEKVSEEYTPPPNKILDRLISESHYENLKSTDGVPINSRKRHRQYMKERGLAPQSDYSNDYLASRRKELERHKDRDRKTDVINVVTRMEQ